MKNLNHIALCALNLILALSATLLPLKPTAVFADDIIAGDSTSESPPSTMISTTDDSPISSTCKDGYEYVEAVGKCYKKCQEGWERNPETNRCRKIRTETKAESPSSVSTAPSSDGSSAASSPAPTSTIDGSSSAAKPASTSSAATSTGSSSTSSPTSSPPTKETTIQTCKDGYEYVETAGKCYKQCQDGYERNPETNRCRKIPNESEYETESTSSTKSSKSIKTSDPTTCKDGYEYVESAGKCYKACSEGQVRSPETNRCKKAEAKTSELKECQDGYERNPETNRCRKIKDNTGADYGIEVPNTGGGGSSFVAGGVIIALLTAVVAFIAFQYRLEIKEFIKKRFKKSEKSS